MLGLSSKEKHCKSKSLFDICSASSQKGCIHARRQACEHLCAPAGRWRHEPVPGASRRDATRTVSSFRVVATSRLVAPTELDSRLHPFSRGSTCRPDRARHQTPPRRLRIRLVDPSGSWVAPCRSDKVRLVRRRVPSDRARHVRLLGLRKACRATRPASGPTRPTSVAKVRARLVRLLRLLGRVARRVAPAARLVRLRSRKFGPDSCDFGRGSSGPTRATRQTPRPVEFFFFGT